MAMSLDALSPRLPERFAVRRRVGSGGMGVVYAAYDNERGELLALKTLRHVEPSGIYNLKKEFRSLADLTHPNLVTLYELIGENDQWFFTMELVDGTTIIDDVRTEGGLDVARLRADFAQLATGVAALHARGVLHRDLKPSNVMVTREGRVVILDFGVAVQARPDGVLSTERAGAGTPAYMAPEQIRGDAPCPASDWYAVGTCLYEALTGRLPFPPERDRGERPPEPSTVAAGVPEDLGQLALALLAPAPERRPSEEEVLARLGVERDGRSDPPAHAPFVGREAYLASLEAAFGLTQQGQAVSVYAHGISGIGKTALMQRFIDDITDRQRAVVLSGRCYERESVPYKALDGVVDSLSRYLESLPPAKAEVLLPRDAQALARLFPVLLRVDAVAAAPYRPQHIPDAWTLRRLAFAALRELLGRIADRHPLVLHIDDLHWADADSTALLEDLLRFPDPPPLLLLASFRSEEIDSRPFLKSLLEHTGTHACQEMEVGPLRDAEARSLVTSILGPGNCPERLVDRILAEAAGSPFFVEQLARYAVATRDTPTHAVGLAQMLEARLERLPPGARELCTTLAVAGRPVPAPVAHAAAGLRGDERPLVGALRAAHFLRSSGAADRVEIYHDRLRVALADAVEDRSPAIHRALVEAHLARGADDPEALFEYALGAGDESAAAGYAVRAAERAASALAFDRAALFYARAIDLSKDDEADLTPLRIGHGDALANAGRSAAAARAYLDAVDHVPAAHALSLRRAAAEQLLMGGYIDEGLEVMHAVLRTVGFQLAGGPRRALLRLMLRRLQLWARGLEFTERRSADVPADELLRVDICWAVAKGLGLVNSIRGAEFQTLHLLLALRAGEPYRIARAMAVEAGFSASPGSRGVRRAAKFITAAESLAHRVGHPHAIGLATLFQGVRAYLVGRWREAAGLLEQAEDVLREQCTGVVWELTSAQRFLLSSLLYLGEIGETARRLPVLLAHAVERGNLYGATDLRTRLNLVWLAADDPERARREVSEALTAWSHEGFHLQHYNSLLAGVQTDLYVGDPGAGWKRIAAEWRPMTKSMLTNVQVLRIEANQAKARLALALAERQDDAGRWLRTAGRLADQIARERMAWADPLAGLVRAGVANLRGDAAGASAALATASDGFRLADMGLHWAAVRRRIGQTTPGERGTALVAEADAWMRDQGIREPARMTAMLAPGFHDDPTR